MSYFDSLCRMQGLATLGASLTGLSGGDIHHQVSLKIPRVIYILNVIIGLVGSGNEV